MNDNDIVLDGAEVMTAGSDPEQIEGYDDAENNENSDFITSYTVDVSSAGSTLYQGAFLGFGIVGVLALASLGVSVIIHIFKNAT